MLKKHSFWTFSIRNWDYKEISNIQFCRASQALSIGIWLNLKGEKVFTEKFLKTKMSIFDVFLSDFWGCLRFAASSEPKEVRQAVIFWIHIWYIRPEIPRGSNPKSVDPHVFRYSKIFDFFMERLLINIKITRSATSPSPDHRYHSFDQKRENETFKTNAKLYQFLLYVGEVSTRFEFFQAGFAIRLCWILFSLC